MSLQVQLALQLLDMAYDLIMISNQRTMFSRMLFQALFAEAYKIITLLKGVTFQTMLNLPMLQDTMKLTPNTKIEILIVITLLMHPWICIPIVQAMTLPTDDILFWKLAFGM